MIEILEKQLAQWEKVLYGYCGVALTLMLIALIELPDRIVNAAQNHYVSVDGWLGLWFILEIAALTPGLILLLAHPWRLLPLARRLPVGFGYLAVAWLGMLAFDLHLVTFLPVSYHIVVFALAAVLSGLYQLLRRNPQRKEELFP